MKVAFCSNDGITINEHFGHAEKIYIYDIREDTYSFLETRNTVRANPNVDHLDAIDEKIKKISDCKIVYFTQIGGPAAAKVIKNKIFPVKVNEGSKIEDIIDAMRNNLKNPPIWLKKILHEEQLSK
ncbi:MAG: nitrogen fixation protein NifX [Calditerrivibrio sp.]|nr:nitrogen fixation protein NifX [Calditerrivibrio sp.]